MIDTLLQYEATWSHLLLVLILLFGLGILLRIAHRVLRSTDYLPRYTKRLREAMRIVLIVYEPVALTIMTSLFVLVNPVLHGIITFIILIGSIGIIRSYLSGRVVRWDADLKTSMQITTDDKVGLISNLGRVGIRIKNEKGVQYVSYRKLMDDGYMLSSGDFGGRYHTIYINTDGSTQTHDRTVSEIEELILASPFVEADPATAVSHDDETGIKLRVLVRDQQHLTHFMRSLRAKNYVIRPQSESISI
ncbi:MAG: hypothetical protein AAFQ02_01180 [Bacteroidota bacterium]